MTPQKRPALVTVVAIINLSFGILGVLCLSCAGFGLAMIVPALQKAPAKPGGPDPMRDLKDLFDVFDKIPGYSTVMLASGVLSLVMSAVLLASGVGLLKMRGWGRMLALAYAVYSLLSAVGMTAYSMAYVQPAIPAAVEEIEKKREADKLPLNPNLSQLKGSAGGGGNPTGNLLGVLYGIALLVLLNLPDVRRAFADAASPPVLPPRDEGRPYYPPPSDDDRVQPG